MTASLQRKIAAAVVSPVGTSVPQDQTSWLLGIGRGLRAQYTEAEEGLPERLAALAVQCDAGTNK
jgi:hypothetical protein